MPLRYEKSAPGRGGHDQAPREDVAGLPIVQEGVLEDDAQVTDKCPVSNT